MHNFINNLTSTLDPILYPNSINMKVSVFLAILGSVTRYVNPNDRLMTDKMN